MSRPSDNEQPDLFSSLIPSTTAPADSAVAVSPAIAPVATSAPAASAATKIKPVANTGVTSAAPHAAKPVTRSGARPQQNQQRPVRRARVSALKATVMSPEARRAAEERNRQLIEEFIAQGKVTKCPTRWAVGAVSMSMFGTDV